MPSWWKVVPVFVEGEGERPIGRNNTAERNTFADNDNTTPATGLSFGCERITAGIRRSYRHRRKMRERHGIHH